MWPFKKKLPQRRLEVRKAKPAVPGWWPRFRQAGGVGSSLLAVLLFAAALFLDATPLEPPGHRRGGYLDLDVYARVRFSMPLPDAGARQAPGRMMRRLALSSSVRSRKLWAALSHATREREAT